MHRDRQGILILGCGYAGAMLAQHLAFAGRPVFGTTRSDQQASIIRSRGAEPIIVDTADLSPLARYQGSIEAVVDCIPPTMHRDGSWEDATAAILDYLTPWKVSKFVYVSSTSVYGDKGGERVDEATACTPDSPRGAARLAIERAVRTHPGVPGCVVRVAGIYGPLRSQLHRMAGGRYRLVDGGQAFTNRIHVLDLARILEAAVDHGERGATYLAADGHAATQAEVADHVVSTWGMPEPTQMSLAEARVRLTKDVLAMITGSKRLDPAATLAALGVEGLRWPDYRSGLAEIWRRESPALQAQAEATRAAREGA